MQGVIISALSANGRASGADAGGLLPTVPRQLKRLPGSVRKCPPSPFGARFLSGSSWVWMRDFSEFALCSLFVRCPCGVFPAASRSPLPGTWPAHTFLPLFFPGGDGRYAPVVFRAGVRVCSPGASSSHASGRFPLASLSLRCAVSGRVAVGNLRLSASVRSP